jgi:hypothetical protein|tara:strand:+ start:357 stop:509 length:153 start_codon:yes stop_codon:yes gene_type:complete
MFIIVVLLVLIAYTIVSLMNHQENQSVVDTMTDQVESVIDVTNDTVDDTY